jgi:hypothetical protein
VKTFLSSVLLLVVVSLCAAQESPAVLRIIVVPSKTEVRVREPFSLALRVENPTTTNQTVRVMNCSWQDEWTNSNPKISEMGWDCAKNFAVNVEIPPGGAYTNESQMLIYDLIPDKELSFRMGFTPIGSNKVFGSNEIKLRILPPDIWQRGTAIYRDRNHDDKIDWEVSSKTWINGGVDTYKTDTNRDGFYDIKYGAGGTNGRTQWSTNVHELVPAVGEDFIPVQKESWVDWWIE